MEVSISYWREEQSYTVLIHGVQMVCHAFKIYRLILCVFSTLENSHILASILFKGSKTYACCLKAALMMSQSISLEMPEKHPSLLFK